MNRVFLSASTQIRCCIWVCVTVLICTCKAVGEEQGRVEYVLVNQDSDVVLSIIRESTGVQTSWMAVSNGAFKAVIPPGFIFPNMGVSWANSNTLFVVTVPSGRSGMQWQRDRNRQSTLTAWWWRPLTSEIIHAGAPIGPRISVVNPRRRPGHGCSVAVSGVDDYIYVVALDCTGTSQWERVEGSGGVTLRGFDWLSTNRLLTAVSPDERQTDLVEFNLSQRKAWGRGTYQGWIPSLAIAQRPGLCAVLHDKDGRGGITLRVAAVQESAVDFGRGVDGYFLPEIAWNRSGTLCLWRTHTAAGVSDASGRGVGEVKLNISAMCWKTDKTAILAQSKTLYEWDITNGSNGLRKYWDFAAAPGRRWNR